LTENELRASAGFSITDDPPSSSTSSAPPSRHRPGARPLDGLAERFSGGGKRWLRARDRERWWALDAPLDRTVNSIY